MLRRLRKLGCIPLAFLVVLLGNQASHALSGLNLCIGASGHVEFESESAGCCPSNSASSDETSLVEAAGSCTSCLDVSLGGHGADTWAASTAPSTLVRFPASSLLGRLHLLRATPAVPERNLPAAATMLALRSVVLRV